MMLRLQPNKVDYVGRGTSYDKWVKTYEAKRTKSWMPYEWFDTAEKLDYPELPPYEHILSKMSTFYRLKNMRNVSKFGVKKK